VSGGPLVDATFWAFGAAAVITGWLVFRTDSMVRAAYWLFASFVAVGVLMVLLSARFLGLVLVLMMAGEMTIMAVFMVMFMMNPAGLNPMTMVHQHRTAVAAGIVAFAGLAGVGLVAEFPDRPVAASAEPTAELGEELLGDSMLVFETAGVTLLATMIGAIALASKRGRFGDADAGSAAPDLDPEPAPAAVAETPAAATETGAPAGEPGNEGGDEGGHDHPHAGGGRETGS
jgi:NADH-quinone oxidoreductase subunit J